MTCRRACRSSSRGCLHLLERRKIVGDAALQVVFRLVAQLLARPRDIVDASRRIGEAVEIQATADLHLRVRNVRLDDTLEVAKRHTYAGSDVVDTAFQLVGGRREIDAERGV